MSEIVFFSMGNLIFSTSDFEPCKPTNSTTSSIIHDGYHECISGEYYILYGDPPDPFIRVIHTFLQSTTDTPPLPYSSDITSDFLHTFPLWRDHVVCSFCKNDM